MAKKLVLVMDDSKVICRQVGTLLKTLEFDHIVAHDGVEGLEACNKEGENLAVILADINMPNMDGITFLKEAKDRGITTPVVMLTTETKKLLIQEAKSLGAKGWLVKPAKEETLTQVFKQIGVL